MSGTPPLPNYPSYYPHESVPYASKLSIDGEGEGVHHGYRGGEMEGGRIGGQEEEGEGMRLNAFRYPAHQRQRELRHEDEPDEEEGEAGESDADVETDMRRVDSPGYETDAESMIGSPTAEYSEHTMSMSTRMPHSPPISSMTMPDSPPPLAVQTQPNSPSHPPRHPFPPIHKTSSQTAVSRPSDASGARSDDTVWERPPADAEAADILHQRQLFRRREDRDIRDTRDTVAGETRETRDAPLTPSSSTHYYADAGPSTSSRALISMPEASRSRPPSARQKPVEKGTEPLGQSVYHRQGIIVSAPPRSSMGDGQRPGKAGAGAVGMVGGGGSRTPSVLALSSEDGGHAPTASSTGVGGIRMPVMQRSGTPRMSDRGTQEQASRRNSVPSMLHPYVS